MPSYLMQVRTAFKNKMPGIKRAGKYYKIRTVSGNWKTVPATALVWHRGNGTWSVYTGVHDRKYRVKTKVKRTKRAKTGHFGDTYKWI